MIRERLAWLDRYVGPDHSATPVGSSDRPGFVSQRAYSPRRLYAGSLVPILTACVVAASVPALRAARIDPIATLRQE